MPIDNRTETIAFRVTKAERQDIERVAKLNKLRVSEYIRLIALNGPSVSWIKEQNHVARSGRD